VKTSRWLALALIPLAAGAACSDGPGGPVFPENHPRIYLPQQGERLRALLDAGDPAATRFAEITDYHVDGGNLYDFRGWMVALMGQLTGDPRYCEFAIAQVDALVAENEAAIASGGAPPVASDSYLEVGAVVGDIAITYDYCADAIDGGTRARWLGFADQAVWNVWHPSEATWGGASMPWTGWSIDNPSNNYYYSFLRATMMLGLATHGETYEGPGSGDEWLAFFRDEKIGGQLIPTFASDLAGGGSREGTGYGASMHRLFELYAMWQGSTGEDLAAQIPHTRATLLQFMHATVPSLDRHAPIGDQSRDSTAMLFDYHRNLVEGAAFQVGGEALTPRAKAYLAASSVPEMDQPFMYVYDFLFALPEVAATSLDGLGTAYHAPGVGQLYARSSWDQDATWWNLLAGPYTESHAHQDQGSLMIWKGEWLAYDAVVDSQSGLRQEVGAHGLVRFTQAGADVPQVAGTTSALTALARGDGWLHAAADLTPAYGDSAAVSNVEREVVFIEPDVLVVFDRVTTAADVSQTWSLLTPLAPALDGPRATMVGAAHQLQVTRLAPAGGALSVVSMAALDGDYHGGFRLESTAPGGAQAHLHVLALDEAVTDASLTDDREATLALADGRTVVVRFGADGVDGALAVSGGPGPDVDVSLDAGVASLPE
jgi:hypothetical protein